MKLNSFNSFKGTILAKRLAVIVSMTIAGTLLAPILVKLQGAYLAAGAISAFATVKMGGGLIQPLLKDVSVYKLFTCLTIATSSLICVIFAHVLGYLSELYTIIAVMIISIVEGIFGCAYLRIIKSGIAAMFIELYDEFQTTVMFLESLAAVLTGITLTVILTLFDIRVGLALAGCFLLIALVIDALTVKNVWWLDKRKEIVIRRKKRS